MVEQWDECRLKSTWNTLFDISALSSCQESDSDLQSISMLLKITFSLFEKLKGRCEVAEALQQVPCQRCSVLEKKVSTYQERLIQAESRMKSIAQIINMGGLTQDKNGSPRKQQSMAKALTQMLFGDGGEISEDDSDTERSSKRKRHSPLIKLDTINTIKKNEVPLVPLTKLTPESATEDQAVIVPESLPPIQPVRTNPVHPQNVILETLCSQLEAPTDVVFLSDGEETFMEEPPRAVVTPTKQRVIQRDEMSPIIGSKGSAKKHLKLRRAQQSLNNSMEIKTRVGENSLLTSSPPLGNTGHSKSSPFTPKLRSTRTNLDLSPMPKNTASEFAQASATPVVGVNADETFVSPSLLGRNKISLTIPKPGVILHVKSDAERIQGIAALDSNRPSPNVQAVQASDFGEIKSTGNVEIDNMLDLICDTTIPTRSKNTGHGPRVVRPPRSNSENIPLKLAPCIPGQKRQADYWKLKPSLSSKEPISMNNGPKLKQTKIGFGIHPERTDLCTLKEFNGGVRQSQISPDLSTLEDFNDGIRPSLTSTMLPAQMLPDYFPEDAEFERAILDSLKDTNTQYDSNDEVIAPSPDVSISKRFVLSQICKKSDQCESGGEGPSHSKQGTDTGVEPRGSTEDPYDEMPNTEDLLHEMGIPNEKTSSVLPSKTVDLIRGFDQVPNRHDETSDHKYQRDAVRKKDERKKLDGWDCAECRRYYAATVDDPIERKKLMNRCSKHRDKYQRQETPPGYWDPIFPSTAELRARNLDITQDAPTLRTRKKRILGSDTSK